MSGGLGRDAGLEWRRSWTVVAAAALGIGLASAPAYTIGVFVSPLEKEFGWSRTTITSGLMFLSVVAVFLGPVVGLAVDRIGARRPAIIGSILVAFGFVLMSRVQAQVWSWWAAWAYMALAAVLVKHMVWTSAVTSLFTHGRGLALAVALCGTSLASTAAPILCAFLIARVGWRLAYVGLGLSFMLLVVPVLIGWFTSAIDRRRTAADGEAAQAAAPVLGVGPREGVTSWRFVRLTLAAVAMVLVATNCMINFVPIAMSFGHPQLAAVGAAGLAGGATIFGRLVGGLLLDRFNGNVVAGISVLMPIPACLLLLLLPGSYPAVAAAALIVGLALGAEYDAVAYLISRHFGMRSFGALFGVVGGVLTAMTGAGPILLSYVYDVTGSYAPGIVGFIPICLAGSALFLTLGRYPTFGPDGATHEPDASLGSKSGAFAGSALSRT